MAHETHEIHEMKSHPDLKALMLSPGSGISGALLAPGVNWGEFRWIKVDWGGGETGIKVARLPAAVRSSFHAYMPRVLPSRFPRIPQVIGAALLFCAVSGAAEPLSYNRDIRPLLSDNCFE